MRSVSPTEGRRATSSSESRTSDRSQSKTSLRDLLINVVGFGVPSKWLTYNEIDPDDYQWEYSYHYFLELLGCTVSLNDLVKFPERCIKYGGVWFLFIHLFFTIVFAFPFFVVENLLGQCSGYTATQAINVICPILGGFGIALMVTRMIELVEVSRWLCWTFLYLFASFCPELPWHKCGHSWNNGSCITASQTAACEAVEKIYWNLTCVLPTKFCQLYSYAEALNKTHCASGSNIVHMKDVTARYSPGHQFMFYITESPLKFEDVSDVYLITAFSMCWVFYYICIRQGLKSSIHVTHFTVTYTFLALLVLLATTVLSEGGLDGVRTHMFQNVEKLSEGEAWIEALRSALDTFSLGLAINFMFAKFNAYSYNFLRPLTWVVVIDITFCVLFSFTVAAFLGMAKNKEPEMHFFTEGIPLLLVSVPKILQHLPSPNVFCCIFYLFCICISMAIGFVLLETILVSIMTVQRKLKGYKQWTRMGLCFSQWCFGIFFFTEPGLRVMDSVRRCNEMDSDFLFAIEAIVITWLYGFGSPMKKKHISDLKDMLGFLPTYQCYLQVGFYITAPLCALIYTISRFASFELPPEDDRWAWLLYFLMLVRSPCILIIFAVLKIRDFHKKRKPFLYLFVSEEEWAFQD